eukprot:m.51948 g.51948  ORF g.51948 m.51948 type:complete len:203 (-) comp11273_c1_seq3:261-869(-)
MSSISEWEKRLKAAKKSAALAGGRKQILYTFPDGSEMVEEYDARTDLLMIRKWRKKSSLGKAGSWELEMGEQFGAAKAGTAEMGLRESSSNPVFSRQDQKKAFQWRVRNIPYPMDVYNITVDGDTIILRTSNKKYFKKFEVADLKRMGLQPTAEDITFTHNGSTLVITLPKPTPVLELEARLAVERAKMKTSEDGDVDCNVS